MAINGGKCVSKRTARGENTHFSMANEGRAKLHLKNGREFIDPLSKMVKKKSLTMCTRTMSDGILQRCRVGVDLVDLRI